MFWKPICLGCLLVALVVPARCAVWTVDLNGGGDFLTIQEALSAASPGDEILVHTGTYIENIDFLGKDVWLHSLDGPTTTIIDGSSGPSGAGTCVCFRSGESTDAILEGFTLTGGHGTTYSGYARGGAIVCHASSATILDCHMLYNSAYYAAAIYCSSAAPSVEDCLFYGNHSQTYGGAIAGPYSDFIVVGCHFEENVAAAGDGAIHVTQGATIVDCVFRNNTARAGAGVNCANFGANAIIQQCEFFGNRAMVYHGGGIRVHEAAPIIEDCVFYDNWAAMDGGGVFSIDGASTTVSGCTLHANGAGRYGGNTASYGSQLSLTNSIVTSATASGGIWVSGGAVECTCCDVWNNSGGDYVGMPDQTGQNGNISEDPRFCDAGGEDFTLESGSPCAEDNNPECGQIGAGGIGCDGPTPAHSITWGGLKAQFADESGFRVR